MTGFLFRMGARASGGLSAAQPRLPSRFAPPEPAADETQVVASGPEPHVDRPTTSEVARRASAPAAPVPVPDSADSGVQEQPPERPAHRMSTVASDSRPAHPRPARRPAATVVPAEGTPAVSQTARGPVQASSRTVEVVADNPLHEAQPVTRAAALPTVVSALATTAVAASPMLPVSLEPVLDPSAADEEASEDVVHISIGRVEVRAALPAPAARRQATAGKQVDQLPLRDYLRGKRETR